MNYSTKAIENILALLNNTYPGRCIVLGRAMDGSLVQIYALMGRSDGSRNRVLEQVLDQHGWVGTRVADPSKVTGDPDLLIYNAMAEDNGIYVVSNGRQTDAVIQDGLIALEYHWRYEPDAPNFTPRIIGVTGPRLDGVLYQRLIILRKSCFGGDGCDHMSYSYREVAAGYGYLISTYSGDGEPLPSFDGEPLIIPIEGADPEEIADVFWSSLNEQNRVAVAVKVIPINGPSQVSIINRHEIV